MLAGWVVAVAFILSSQARSSDEVVHEIIVEGELEVQRARRAVEHELKQRGYVPKKRKKNYLLFRHPQDWKGEIRLYDDGWVRMKRQPIQLRAPNVPGLGKGAALLCLIAPPACIKARGQTVSRRKFMGQKVRTLEGLRPQLDAYAAAVSNLHTDQAVADLPERLAKLWEDGVSLMGVDVQLKTSEERKAEVLRFWESRTENRWGNRVRATIEVFIREEIQYSKNSFTEVEIKRFNATRKCKAALDLGRPWDEIEKALESESSGL